MKLFKDLIETKWKIFSEKLQTQRKIEGHPQASHHKTFIQSSLTHNHIIFLESKTVVFSCVQYAIACNLSVRKVNF